MGFRFRKSFNLLGKFVKLNLNKDSVSVTAGVPGVLSNPICFNNN